MRRDDREGGGREGKSGRRGRDCVSERVRAAGGGGGVGGVEADGSAQRKGGWEEEGG